MKVSPVTLEASKLLFKGEGPVLQLGLEGIANLTGTEFRPCPEAKYLLPPLVVHRVEGSVPWGEAV